MADFDTASYIMIWKKSSEAVPGGHFQYDLAKLREAGASDADIEELRAAGVAVE